MLDHLDALSSDGGVGKSGSVDPRVTSEGYLIFGPGSIEYLTSKAKHHKIAMFHTSLIYKHLL